MSDAVILTTADLSTVRLELGAEEHGIELHVRPDAAEKLFAATGEHIGYPIAMFVDGQLHSAPNLVDRLRDVLWIYGGFSDEELSALAQRLAKELEASPTVSAASDCSWSSVWRSMQAAPPGSGALTAPQHRKGSLERPHPNPGDRFLLEGLWIFSLVVDAKGKVADARVVQSASTPPWPRYEAQLLKSLRKWRFTPATLDGKPVPFCHTVTAKDR